MEFVIFFCSENKQMRKRAQTNKMWDFRACSVAVGRLPCEPSPLNLGTSSLSRSSVWL